MVNVVYRKNGVRINSVWFCDDIDNVIRESRADILFLHGVDLHADKLQTLNKLQGSLMVVEQYSLKTDLKTPMEEIFSHFRKNYRYEINRAKKENLECVVYNSKDLKDKPYLVSQFETEFNEFIRRKQVRLSFNRSALWSYIRNGNIILTKVFKDSLNLAQHIYVCDEKRARLLYSVSNFRSGVADADLVGRANKLLHYFDIEHFIALGLEMLDWGGISSIDKPNGIDNFKMGFGGEPITYYNVIIGKTVVGMVAIQLAKLKSGLIRLLAKIR